MTRRLISVIAPAYNEEDCVDELVRRLTAVFDSNDNYDFEAVIVENGSTDSTFELLKRASMVDGRFKVLRLSRNFGMDGGITAGLEHISGDAAVIMTADLQDPPELITTFLQKWEEGYENIYMTVTERTGTGPLRRLNTRLFYWLADRLTDHRIPRDASDFRLVDRKVYESVREMRERNRFVRGLFAWVGFRSISVEHARPARFAGRSKAHTRTVLNLALKGVLAHSYLPLKLITMSGIFCSVISFVTLVVMSAFWIIVGVPFAGFGTIVAIGLLAFGLLASMIGILAEYLGLVYEEVKYRPNFLVSEALGIQTEEDQ